MKSGKATFPLFSVLLVCLSLLPPTSHSQSGSLNDSSALCGNSSNAIIEYTQCLNDTPEWESCPDPSLCEATSRNNNIGLAFGLTIGAGLATTLGALVPFIPFIKRSNTKFLAIGLALAAGVMLYVSFTEILKKSKDNFCCITSTHYEVAATGCFFGGIILIVVLDLFVGLLQRIDCGCGCRSKCTRRRGYNLDETGTCKNLKVTKGKAFHQSKTSKHRMYGVKKLHKNFDFLPYHSLEGHAPMVSSSEASTISTPTTKSMEDGEELAPMSAAPGSETESTEAPASQPMPSCSSQRALLSNEVVPSSSAGVGVVEGGPFTRQSSISDTESRRHTAITSDGVSATFSENTNNYANASVNELFSNSSLLRMNAIILPERISTSADSATGDDNVGVAVRTDSKSNVSVLVDDCSEGDVAVSVDGEDEGETSKKLVRRHSYSEMVEQKHDDVPESMGAEEFKEVTMVMGKDVRKLHRMGILTGLAIGIHNFPEGLATFVAAHSSHSLGIALAIAIALHNIPEGVCVAMPVYYATGKKWKGFLWAFLSGISEPFGALLGWLVFKDLFGPLVYGCLFGIIAGMMVFISLKELLPTAHKFDKRGILVAVFVVVGMVVMAASLVLFLY